MGTEFPSGIYRIKNAKAETYLTGSPDEPGTVYCWESRPDYEYQKWDLELIEATDGGPVYHVRNRGDARFLATYGSGSKSRICKALENPTRWVFLDPKFSGECYIAVEGMNTIVNLMFGLQHNGATITAVEKDDSLLNRRWRLKRVGDKYADRLRISRTISDNTTSPQPVDQASVYPERPSENPAGQYIGIIPLATYSIRNVVAGDVPLNPDPYGSTKWTLQAGQRGYFFRSKKLGTFLGYDREKIKEKNVPVVISTEPIEWVIGRAHKGYYIQPAANQTLFVGIDSSNSIDHIPILILSSQDGRRKQVWGFGMAN